ncbi:MAG: PAS domain-containing sensor histidine kinase [Betaproteobacteria bacterium]|nr:PAS domain-containing sensor histidine kinase [Betaproteobacteria bacterium]
MIDHQSRILMVDAPGTALLRRAPGSLAGQALTDCLTPDSAERLRLALARCAEAVPVAGLWLTPAGASEADRLQANLTAAHLDTGSGLKPVACLRLHRPVTNESLSEQISALRARQMQLFDQTPTAAIVCRNAVIGYANRRAVALFGASAVESLVGMNCHDLVAPECRPALDGHIAQALAGEPEVPMVQLTINRLDGSQRQAEIVLATLPGFGEDLTLALLHDVSRHNGERLELERSRAELRSLSGSLVEAREEERRRIARELHDDLGQRLSWMKMELSDIAEHGSRPATRARMAAMLELLDETMASLRRISADMRPLMLDDLGLNAAVEWLGREASRRMGIEVTTSLGEIEPSVDDRTATTVYRIVQEALTNIGRHARATDARIIIEQLDRELVLTVQDNGVGFPDSAVRKEGSFGLMGIRERAILLGGRFAVDNPPGGGGRLRVWLPLSGDAHTAPLAA